MDVIREIIGNKKSKSHSHLPNRICLNDEVITDKIKINECFNKYFTDIGINLANKITPTSSNFNEFLTGNYPDLNENLFTDDEIKVAFDLLKPNSCAGFDDINPKIRL